MRRLIVLSVLTLVVVGGCLAPVGSTGESPDGATETPTATQTPQITTQTPQLASETPTADDPPPDARNGTTVEYDDLTPKQQAAFDTAVDGRVQFVPDSPYVDGTFHFDDAEPFRSHEYVRKNGNYYAIQTSYGDLYASYMIDATVASPDDENVTVVALGNLSTDVRDEVRWAVENGSYTTPLGQWGSLPGELRETDYVRYDGEVYRLGYAVGDSWADVLTVERTD